MGGKTKQAPRTKNNARPSNSGRSAELLGSTVPTFVGFTAHSDLGMIPLAPGFSTVDSLPETFDSNISPEIQVTLRKLSKKDPVTKAKALQELNIQIMESDIEMTKSILPLWPKFYHNLSNDVEHRVREATQLVQSSISQKAGKFIAPYIKQLAPVWITSQFDSYGPASSAAISSFKTSFPPHKVQEVLLYCQNEIMDYLTKNISFHTASTLSNMKSVTPQEAESKYQRVIISSMKTFSFFIEKTSSKSNLDVDEKCKTLLQHQKFWSFSKNKISKIRSAFFELLSAVLQYAPRLIEANKSQIIQVCFQNLDDLDPLTSPHVWECVLLIQSLFIDWHEQITFKKVIQPKFATIFKAISNGGASCIARNFLPFLCKLSENSVKDLRLYEFYIEFFDNVKSTIQLSSNLTNVNISKADVISLVIAYFECLRFVFKKISNDVKENIALNQVYQEYLQKYVIDFLKWNLEIENQMNKHIYKHCSALIAYWSSNSQTQCYSELLSLFWSSLLSVITNSISVNNLSEISVKNIVELIKNLYSASPALHDSKVKFGDNSKENVTKKDSDTKIKCSKYVSKDLKEIVIKIVKIYLENTTKNETCKYACQLKTLCQMFGDIDFYKRLSSDANLLTTITRIINIISDSEIISDDLLDVLFGILHLLNESEKTEQLKILVKIRNPKLQLLILQRILSYPLCVEPAIRDILTEKDVVNIIIQTSKEAVNEDSSEKFNILKKCFFQPDCDKILINNNVMENIVNTVIEPLNTPGKEKIIDTCASFVAQIMPIICMDENSTNEFRNKVFLELFKFSINSSVNENLSEDSLWEVTTCWQDSLSCKDISLDESLLFDCKNILENRITSSNELSIENMNNISNMVAKLILCLKDLNEKNQNNKENVEFIDILLKFSDLHTKVLTDLNNICKFHEALEKVITVDNLTNDYSRSISIDTIRNFYRRVYYSYSVIFKLFCEVTLDKKKNSEAESDDETSLNEEELENPEKRKNEDGELSENWSSETCEFIAVCTNMSALGESLLKNSTLLNEEVETIILNLSEKITILLQNSSEDNVNILKEKIIQKALNGDLLWMRSLPYLLHTKYYQQYNESGPIVLMEEVADLLLRNGKFEIYNNLAEIFLPHLTPCSLIFNEDILSNVNNIKFLSSLLRNLLENHMSNRTYNNLEDKNLVKSCIKFVSQIGEQQAVNKEKFLYNVDIGIQPFNSFIEVNEFIKLLTETLNRFPSELNIKNWDSIRIGLCSWVLTISKSIGKIYDPKVSLFTVSVYELFESLSKFIKAEKSKSSTQFLLNIIDEWENVFSKEVNLVLFKNFHFLVNMKEGKDNVSFALILEKIASCVIHLDYNIIYNACQHGFKMNVNDLIEFSLENLSYLKNVRKSCANILKGISVYVMKDDLKELERNNESFNAVKKSNEDYHFLKRFEPFVEKYGQRVEKYINEFSFKLTELQDLKPIEKDSALTYFYLWDCIIYIFSKAPVELKSLYATWITNNKYEELLLNFIFRAMPIEILKNHDQKTVNNEIFKINIWQSQFEDGTLSVEKCACYMYTQMLRNLPVLVRKWWNSAHSRQKNFVDKLTTNYVSNLIWQEDLQAINKTEKQENMQITVHQSTREVIAFYAIDEARMELVITLPQNHPLGVIKVEMGKQIGGKASSRNIGMQLTIFLTHQNGCIFDGLSLWKKNLDKKFSGVEECYVCYTVIHQDTCQLPKLTCKTCKKKFHGPCLYKWFTTSSKSTCPLCRNVF
ncbi:E3 ubiquitin-protein ligase listerin [Condylostylus longicornis]|uniref:E3 ubiquitin-protein ligase listerin n=1 Tax=Condylostylus longicornis TaxID=2530218 RepID=UPI00244E011E|nr:E3 ubiquitin-protein ligase listerin [Condylostylus longicornis]